MKKTIIPTLIFISMSIFSQSTPISSISFTIEKNCIYFYCRVNETDSIKFLFDTGADGSVINKQSLTALQLKLDGKSLNEGSNGTNEVESSSGNEIKIGNISKKGVLFTVIPFETTTFDGIMGTDLMQGYIIEIDYNNQVLNIYDKNDETINYKGYTRLKLYTNDYPTYIKSSIIVKNKRYTGMFGLDTGADDALTVASPFAKDKDFINKMTKVGSAGFQGSDGSMYEMPIVLFPEIEFAGKHLYRIPTALSNSTEGIDASKKLAGFYGNAFLKKFNIILDYENHNIFFKLNKNLYKE